MDARRATHAWERRRLAGMHLLLLAASLLLVGCEDALRPIQPPPEPRRDIVFTNSRGFRTHALYAIFADGTGLIRLTRDSLAAGRPTWSPDGTRIAFPGCDLRLENNLCDLYSVNADGSGETRLTTLATTGRGVHQALWSPRGDRIAFLSHSSADEPGFRIHIVRPDGNGQIVLATGNDLSGLIWSPDGTRIAYVRDNSTIHLVSVDPSNPADHRELVHGRMPSWSPDGSRIAFTASRYEGCGGVYPCVDIYVINTDGSGRSALTHSGSLWQEPRGRPVWSPDGARIAYSRSVLRPGTPGPLPEHEFLHVMNADGSMDGQVAGPLYFYPELTWSPDGRRIAFASRFDWHQRKIYLVDPSTGELEQLTHHEGDDSAPSWRPR